LRIPSAVLFRAPAGATQADRFAIITAGQGASMTQRLPSTRVRPMPDWSGWYVELIWPDGRVDHIDKFGSASTARAWISRELPSYLADDGAV